VKKSTCPCNVIPSSRWAAYASAGLATVFGGAGAVEAEIHYSGPVKQVFDVGSHSTVEHSFAVQSGVHLNFQFARFGAGRGSAFFSIDGAAAGDSFRGMLSSSGFAGYPSKLHPGDLISDGSFAPGSVFGILAESVENGASQWKRPGTGFIGFSFDTGSGLQYGWARVRTRRDNSFILVDYAWGDPGDAVVAGQKESSSAPQENGSLGWLALGAAGLTALRQTRRAGGGGELND
jgi:hypothetical protein